MTTPDARAALPAPIFALRDVGKTYGAIHACRNVSFEIHPGDIIGLAGENGAGKSTSMKCLAGWIAPSSGTVECDGAAVVFAGPRDAETAGIAVIPQELDLFPELTVHENVFAGMRWPRNRIGLFDRKAMKARAEVILRRLGAGFDVAAPVKSLSPANQKLVEIARALNRRARLIIMDEPTAALTEYESDRLFRVIHELRAAGTAIIHITHRLDEIFEHCNRLVVLRDGQVADQGDTARFDAQKLIKAMVGRPVSRLYERRTRLPRGEALFEARGVSSRRRFADISLTLHRSEILGVAGLIGAGRTEFAHAAAGIHPADAGEFVVRGRAEPIRSVKDARRLGIAYLPEERRSQGLHLAYPISWNISFGTLSRVSRAGMVDAAREQGFATGEARRFGVNTSDLSLPVGALSGGNQQKVLLAKILAGDPEIVILDEPTRGVDIGAKAEIYALIERLAEAGKAVMLISSEMEEILSLSDRIATFHQGRLNAILERDGFSADAIGHAVSGRPHHV